MPREVVILHFASLHWSSPRLPGYTLRTINAGIGRQYPQYLDYRYPKAKPNHNHVCPLTLS